MHQGKSEAGSNSDGPHVRNPSRTIMVATFRPRVCNRPGGKTLAHLHFSVVFQHEVFLKRGVHLPQQTLPQLDTRVDPKHLPSIRVTPKQLQSSAGRRWLFHEGRKVNGPWDLVVIPIAHSRI